MRVIIQTLVCLKMQFLKVLFYDYLNNILYVSVWHSLVEAMTTGETMISGQNSVYLTKLQCQV